LERTHINYRPLPLSSLQFVRKWVVDEDRTASRRASVSLATDRSLRELSVSCLCLEFERPGRWCLHVDVVFDAKRFRTLENRRKAQMW
jgi:hypothetical protein